MCAFSNPNQTYRGDPLGISGERVSLDVGGPANAARVLNAMRHSVAGIRGSDPWSLDRAQWKRNSSSTTGRRCWPPPVRLPPSPGGTELFVAPTQADDGRGDSTGPRRRAITVDTERLVHLVTARGPVAAPAPVLNLFHDVVLTAIVERRTPTFSGGHALTGHLQGIDSGALTLVVNGAVVAGTVWTPGEAFPHPTRRPGAACHHPGQLARTPPARTRVMPTPRPRTSPIEHRGASAFTSPTAT